MSKQLFRKPNREDWDDISKLGFRNSGNKIIGVYVDPVFEGARKACVTVVRIASNGSYITTQHHIDGTFQESAISDWDIWVVDEEEPEQIKHKPLTREDWNDISKLTFKDASHYQIIEVKVIESFIGVKPFPVVVLIKALADEIIGRQYTLEGLPENNADCFQIIKVKEPETVNYEEIVKELMIKGVFVSQYKKVWYHVSAYDSENKQFRTFEKRHPLEDLIYFYFSFDLENFYDFDTYLTLRGKS